MLQIILLIILLVLGIVGNWTLTSAPSGRWYSVASDSTGQYLAAAQYKDDTDNLGYIYTSTSG